MHWGAGSETQMTSQSQDVSHLKISEELGWVRTNLDPWTGKGLYIRIQHICARAVGFCACAQMPPAPGRLPL